MMDLCDYQGETVVCWEAGGDSTASKSGWCQVLLRQSMALSTKR